MPTKTVNANAVANRLWSFIDISLNRWNSE
jgi:hypothetical protein